MISVVIPAKNEANNLKSLIPKLRSVACIDEIIVVDDGSEDDTFRISSEAGAKVVSHPYSKGNGAAIKTGARAAEGDIIIFMDGDGQHDPADIPRLLEKIKEGYDLVVGARGRESQASVGRGLANGLYNKLASYMTGHPVKDLTSGFRAVRRDKFLEFLYLLPNGFSYPTTSTMAFFRAGYSVAYVPITAHERVGVSHIRPLKDGIRFLLIIFKIGTLYSPLKLFLPIALFIFSIGLGYYAFTYFLAGRFTNMSALMFTTSLVIFMVGLVSEQITALMYRDTEKR
ncbi:glycosyltransferase family 2 protein [Marinobacter sp. CA1]|uniref:glycosyltransferase family 2 protein n=1 Tax=Marinobacter sp. CA1 TaxID=2817656 RepID=UPI001D088A99|nr:glycosyltransferase family 2 protein [Marinobacter sp. CA1]